MSVNLLSMLVMTTRWTLWSADTFPVTPTMYLGITSINPNTQISPPAVLAQGKSDVSSRLKHADDKDIFIDMFEDLAVCVSSISLAC